MEQFPRTEDITVTEMNPKSMVIVNGIRSLFKNGMKAASVSCTWDTSIEITSGEHMNEYEIWFICFFLSFYLSWDYN